MLHIKNSINDYNLSVEGLVDGRIAIFTDVIEVGPSIVDEPTRLMILSEDPCTSGGK